MKRIRLEIGWLLTGGMLVLAAARLQGQIDTSGLQEVPRDQLPKVATFYWATGHLPPLPCPPGDLDVPIYALGSNHFLIDNSVDSGLLSDSSSVLSASFPHGPGGGSADDPWLPDSARNSLKFAAQHFSLIDTNDAAQNDTNLYNFLLTFPDDTNTYPTLQIKLYGKNAAIIKANHFDYSSDDRDFALLVCDSPAKPTWKNVSLSGASDSQDGWLIQGLVANWRVGDPMFMMVSNILSVREAVFRAVPYGGPVVALSGPNDYDTVSNSIALQATIADLSGTSNEQFSVQVNGLDARITRSNNTFNVDTRFAANTSVSGLYNEIEVTIENTNALVSDPSAFVSDTKQIFDAIATRTLGFENATYVAFASDMCSPDVGTNNMLFGVDQAQNATVAIKDPTTGRTVASLAGYIPSAGIVGVPWDFKETNGAPYTNDNYSVTFAAQAAGTALTVTNRIDRQGVRTVAGNILTYEEEDPTSPAGPYLNSQANTWIGGLAIGLYQGLYYNDFASLMQYYPWQIGNNRDNPVWTSFPYVLNNLSQTTWPDRIHFSLTNLLFSDFGYYQGHGSGSQIGGSPPGSSWVTNTIEPFDVAVWIRTPHTNNWRMRKVVMWACYTGQSRLASAGGTYTDWQSAFGIRPTKVQTSSMMWKNAGVFFNGQLPQGFGTTTSSYIAAQFDSLWVGGPNAFPGGADPTYAIAWAAAQITAIYPQLNAKSVGFDGVGYPFLPFTGNYDSSELLTNIVTIDGPPVDIKTR